MVSINFTGLPLGTTQPDVEACLKEFGVSARRITISQDSSRGTSFMQAVVEFEETAGKAAVDFGRISVSEKFKACIAKKIIERCKETVANLVAAFQANETNTNNAVSGHLDQINTIVSALTGTISTASTEFMNAMNSINQDILTSLVGTGGNYDSTCIDITSLVGQISTLSQLLEECKDTNTTLTNQLTECQNTNTTITNQLTECQNTNTNLTTDLGNCNNTNNQLNITINQLNATITLLKKQLQDKINTLNALILSMQTTVNETEALLMDVSVSTGITTVNVSGRSRSIDYTTKMAELKAKFEQMKNTYSTIVNSSFGDLS